MTPVRNNGEGISPIGKAVNDTLLCAELVSILENLPLSESAATMENILH